jgi:hypothetical protein
MAAAMLVALAAITYRNAKAKTGPLAPLPLPSQYVAPVLLFGVLGLASGSAEAPAFAMAVAIDIGIVLNLWTVDATGRLSVNGPGGTSVSAANTAGTAGVSGPAGPPSNPTGPAGPQG